MSGSRYLASLWCALYSVVLVLGPLFQALPLRDGLVRRAVLHCLSLLAVPVLALLHLMAIAGGAAYRAYSRGREADGGSTLDEIVDEDDDDDEENEGGKGQDTETSPLLLVF